MALVVSTWLWSSKYSADYVTKLVAGVRRHLKQPHRFVVITDKPAYYGVNVECLPIEDMALTEVAGCFARLRMFSPEWQQRNGITDRLANIDLDTVITGQIDPLFDRPEPFVILQGGNAGNPCPYGGALMMIRPGAHPEIWNDFSLEAASTIPKHEFVDDQGWIAHKVKGAAGWKVGPDHGVYVFRKPLWPVNDVLPPGARLVTFNGWRNPEKFKNLNWVRRHWQ